MLGVKPQKLDEVAAAIAPRIKGVPLLLSILAGVEVAALAKRYEAKAIVRVMPNLPVGLGKGVVALHGVDPESVPRSEEHTSELQSLMRSSYADFCLKKKNKQSQA